MPESALFSRSLDWLYKAFRLEEPSAPRRLATELLQPVVDVGQKGAAFGEIESTLITVPELQPAFVLDIFQNEYHEQSLIVATRLAHVGGAAPAEYAFRISERNTVGGSQPLMIKRTLAIGGDESNVDSWGGAPNIARWVPPDWKLQVSTPVSIAAEQHIIRVVRWKFPRGFSPW